MDYYQVLAKFEQDEASFTVQSPWDSALYYSDVDSRLFQQAPYVLVDHCYEQYGMSDWLKIGVGLLASKKVQQIFFEQGFSGIQFVPLAVDNKGLNRDFAFAHTTAYYDLLDPDASEATRFNKKRGLYRNVFEERIDKAKFERTPIRHDCFTLTNYRASYYVSTQVKQALEAAGITGVKFIPMKFASIESV